MIPKNVFHAKVRISEKPECKRKQTEAHHSSGAHPSFLLLPAVLLPFTHRRKLFGRDSTFTPCRCVYKNICVNRKSSPASVFGPRIEARLVDVRCPLDIPMKSSWSPGIKCHSWQTTRAPWKPSDKMGEVVSDQAAHNGTRGLRKSRSQLTVKVAH